jgi:hypothetical protein
LSNISKILSDEQITTDVLTEDLKINEFKHFKYASISFVDVERSNFLKKYIIADNRRLFLFENPLKSLVVNFNY